MNQFILQFELQTGVFLPLQPTSGAVLKKSCCRLRNFRFLLFFVLRSTEAKKKVRVWRPSFFCVWCLIKMHVRKFLEEKVYVV